MLGSPDYSRCGSPARSTGATALRQPGSSIKPLTYAAAFASGNLTPATMMLDVRTSFVTREGASYVPLNYDLQFHGPVRPARGTGLVLQPAAVKVLDTVGIEAMTGLARRLGITTLTIPTAGPGGDARRRRGAAAGAGGGLRRFCQWRPPGPAKGRPACGRRRRTDPVVARPGPLFTSRTAEGKRVLDERVAYLISDVLSDDLARIPSFGDGSVLELSRPGGGQDRHNHRLSRQLDGRLYTRPGGGCVGGQRRQRDDARHFGDQRRGADLARFRGGGAQGPAGFASSSGLMGWSKWRCAPCRACCPSRIAPHRVHRAVPGRAPSRPSGARCTSASPWTAPTGLRATAATHPTDRRAVYTILAATGAGVGAGAGMSGKLPLSEHQRSAIFGQTEIELSANAGNPESRAASFWRQNQEFIMMVGPDAGSVYQLMRRSRASRSGLWCRPWQGRRDAGELILYVDGHSPGPALARRLPGDVAVGGRRASLLGEGVDTGGNRSRVTRYGKCQE